MKLQILLLTAVLLLAGCAETTDDGAEEDAHDSMSHSEIGHDDHMDGMDGMDHDGCEPATHEHDEDMGAHHEHGAYEVPACEGSPAISITAAPDAKSGINVKLTLEDFQFAPLDVSTEHQAGEGHAHVYLDGVKLGRVYTEWIHINAGAGEHEVRVTLNSNDHSQLSVNGHLVEDTVNVTIPETELEQPGGHGHMHMAHDGAGMSVEIVAHEDPVSSENYVIEINPVGFTFAPEHASGDPVSGEGHAHIYLDGVKLGRVYGGFHHIGGLDVGYHEITVTLNGNDHADYKIDGEVFEDTVTIVI